MYDITIKCTYHKAEYSQQEKEFQKDYLRFFGLKEFDLDMVNDIIIDLYQKLIHSKEMKECIKLAASQMLSEDEILGTMMLFSFHNLHYTVPCVSSFLNNDFEEHKLAVAELKNNLLR